MIGTIQRTNSLLNKRLSASEQSMRFLRVLGWMGRQQLRNISTGKVRRDRWQKPKFAKTIRSLMRASALAVEFKSVEIDPQCTRPIKVQESHNGYHRDKEILAPLLFSTVLPAKIKTVMEFKAGDSRYKASAVTPMPTPEALAAIRKHGKKFDHIELWWVPNDVLVEQIPDPDPIVVGAVKIPTGETYYFELHRWVDESVEVGWWAKEGY